MDASDVAIKAAVETAIALVAHRIGRSTAKLSQPPHRIPEHLSIHLTEALRWSSRYQFLGMPRPANIDEDSIALSIDSLPRKFCGSEHEAALLGEEDLLANSEHYNLLGDPGSGKTTTVKRLIRHVLVESPRSAKDEFQYPIVIRLREHRHQERLLQAIADAVGLVCTEHISVVAGVTHKELRIGDAPLEYAIPRFLNESGAILFLDGLDEVEGSSASALRSSVELLALRLNGPKLIATCRTGDALSHLEGVLSIELRPLSRQQVQEIAGGWLNDPKPFLHALDALPYADLADRPLLLVQLIVIFMRQGTLPVQPAQVCEHMVRLLLEDWDAQRQIVRRSKYADFTSDRKLAFLAALSYNLTYIAKAKTFAKADLLAAYEAIHGMHGLEKGEAERVVRELQSHTGILMEGRLDTYEFSHLSLQEYLCAYHLVRAPAPALLSKYVAEYTAPLAVSVALSSDPAGWFGSLILRESVFHGFGTNGLVSLLQRLLIERPRFEESPLLGLCLIRLSTEARSRGEASLNAVVAHLWDLKEAPNSVGSALMYFAIRSDAAASDDVALQKRSGYLNVYGFEVPERAYVPMRQLKRALATKATSVVWEDDTGALRDMNASRPSWLDED